jgi:hypothetical protein
VGPHPNLLSPRFQAWEKQIYAALAPVVVEWLKTLPAEKQWLFVGWKCGWETTPNSQYAYYNYDTMKGQPEIERAMLDAMALCSGDAVQRYDTPDRTRR